jgi:two-component system CheB/CheR fusion protein
VTVSRQPAGFEALLDYLKRTRSFDFSAYKRPSLVRRVTKRLAEVGAERFEDYIDYLEVHPDEYAHLFNTILINVTAFFRDAHAWEFIAAHVLPYVVNSKQPGDAIRLWSAGCASGEETYTLAMLTAEAVGIEQFGERVKIYATDVDEDALNKARQASYSLRELSGVPAPFLEKYFEPVAGRYAFRKDLRRSIIFGRHDLVQDAPISRIDLLVCRNALMYFNAEAQSRILSRFHFALTDGGFLFLGKAEMLLAHSEVFSAVELKRRVFAKATRGSLRERLMVMASTGNDDAVDTIMNQVRVRDAAFDVTPVAQVVVDSHGNLVLANERARTLFSLTMRDLGRPLKDLELSYRPVELRSSIDRAFTERRAINLADVEWHRPVGGPLVLDVSILPLNHEDSSVVGTSVTFADVSRYKRLQDELAHSGQELETAYEELQSTNEELETTNEELQSTNEELQTINEELQQRSAELNRANAFLESILTGMRSGVVVVDLDLRIQIWNSRAEDLWGLRADEVIGRNLLNLDIGLPVEQLRTPVRACMMGEASHCEVALAATNRRGKAMLCVVTCAPLRAADKAIVQGVIVLMEERESRTTG